METIKDKINNILGHSCVVIAGQSPSGESYNTVGKGIEFHQGKKAFGDNVVQHSGIWTTEITKVAEPGDILLSVRAPVGPTNLTDRQLCIGRGLAAIRCSEKVLPKYVLFALKSIEYKIVGHEGVGFNSINKQQIEQLPLPIIPLKEQEEIVAYLDGEFERIEKLKRNAEAALQHTKDLFQSTLKQLLTPKPNWEEKKLEDISDIAGDYGLSVSSIPYNGVRYLRITDITDLGELNPEKVSADLSDGQKQEKLLEGDILFARTGATVGKTLIYKKEFGECLFAGYLIRYRLDKKKVLPQFMYYITHSNKYYQWVKANQKIGAQPNIGAKLYNSYQISFPPLAEQQAIVSRLDTLSEHCRKLEQNYRDTLTLCDDLKQALLREVFE